MRSEVLSVLALLAVGCAGEKENPVSNPADPYADLTVPTPPIVTGWPCPPFDGVSTTEDKIGDSDNDTLTDCQEEQLGSGPEDPDSDGDGVGDEFEVGEDLLAPRDTDLDNTIDLLDTDDDGDGVPTLDEDLVENGGDGDGDPRLDDVELDGIPNYLDSDDDNDFLYGLDEDSNGNGNILDDDVDGDGALNRLDSDDDNDGVPSIEEDANSNRLGRDDNTDGDFYYDPKHSRADGYGFVALLDWMDLDDDGDGVLTSLEDWDGDGNLLNHDLDRDFRLDFQDADEDGDTVNTLPSWPYTAETRHCPVAPVESVSATALAGTLQFGGAIATVDTYGTATFDEYAIATTPGETVSVTVDVTDAASAFSPRLVVLDEHGCAQVVSTQGAGFACSGDGAYTCASAQFTATGATAYVHVSHWWANTPAPAGASGTYQVIVDALAPDVHRVADNVVMEAYGATQFEFGMADADRDGTYNWRDPDDDGDTIFGNLEDEEKYDGSGDTVPGWGTVVDDDMDADGLPNFLDDDDDADGCPTANEGGYNGDTDGDNLPNFLDSDDSCATPLTFRVDLTGAGFDAYDGEQVKVVALDAGGNAVNTVSTTVSAGGFLASVPGLTRGAEYSLAVLVDLDGACETSGGTGDTGGDTGAGGGATGGTGAAGTGDTGGGKVVVEVEGVWSIAGIVEDLHPFHDVTLDAADPQDPGACAQF